MPPATQCFQGRTCYVDSLYMTILACALAFVLSVYASWRDRRRVGALVAAVGTGEEGGVRLSRSRSRSRSAGHEVVWDDRDG